MGLNQDEQLRHTDLLKVLKPKFLFKTLAGWVIELMKKWAITASMVMILLLLSACSESVVDIVTFSKSRQIKIFNQLWEIVNADYVYRDFNGVDWEAVRTRYKAKIDAGLNREQFYLTMQEMVTELGDGHSKFIPPKSINSSCQRSEMFDIGAYVSMRQNTVFITAILPGSNADQAGLRPGDVILEINDLTIADRMFFCLFDGNSGERIRLQYLDSKGQIREAEVRREKNIDDSLVISRIIEHNDNLRFGYIFFAYFGDDIDKNFSEALFSLTKENINGLIIDLRTNRGGLNTSLEKVIAFFVGGDIGSYVSVHEKKEIILTLNDINGSSNLPVVLLISEATQSAAELFAGLLRDTKQVTMIGETTAGNMEVTRLLKSNAGSQLYLPYYFFYSKLNDYSKFENVGISPDIEVPGAERIILNPQDDPCVQTAIDYLVGNGADLPLP